MGIGKKVLKRAVFLDRDGVINANVYHAATREWESPLVPAELEILPGALDGLKRLVGHYLLFLVSNQPAHAKGKTTLEEIQAIHDKLHSALTQEGVRFADYFYCYHHPLGVVPGYSGPCVCRKPSPFFLKEAARRYEADLSVSWMVGDREADILCGNAAGVRTILVRDPHAGAGGAGKIEAKPDFKADNLSKAVEIVLKYS